MIPTIYNLYTMASTPQSWAGWVCSTMSVLMVHDGSHPPSPLLDMIPPCQLPDS